VEHRLAHADKPDSATRLQITLQATGAVAIPLVAGVVIIIMVFMPLVSLQGLEGRLFSPIALTVAVALAADPQQKRDFRLGMGAWRYQDV
jgi:heavy metal efflux system protein